MLPLFHSICGHNGGKKKMIAASLPLKSGNPRKEMRHHFQTETSGLSGDRSIVTGLNPELDLSACFVFERFRRI